MTCLSKTFLLNEINNVSVLKAELDSFLDKLFLHRGEELWGFFLIVLALHGLLIRQLMLDFPFFCLQYLLWNNRFFLHEAKKLARDFFKDFLGEKSWIILEL